MSDPKITSPSATRVGEGLRSLPREASETARRCLLLPGMYQPCGNSKQSGWEPAVLLGG